MHSKTISWMNIPFDSFKMRKKVQTINEDIPFTDDEIRVMFRLPLFHGEQSLYGEMAYWMPIILLLYRCSR
ncbi:hypothetical protein LNQ03_14925 [Klebsiella pneumoniae subsp. pneumoniae]|nr:hypothetical protein [Klebsiella pneumoniae subsp. pneumoniae]